MAIERENSHPWTEDWQERLYSRLSDFGTSTVIDFLQQRPRVSYVQLANELGHFAALQIQLLQLKEARTTKDVTTAAKDSLVRAIRSRLKKGWATGIRAEYNTAAAYADWVGILNVDSQGPDLTPTALKVWTTLKAIPPQKGWLPESPEDPLMTEAFSRSWNIE